MFGKQEMRVVNIDDVGGGGEGGNHNSPAAPGGGKPNGGALLKSEDKNKPAKCMFITFTIPYTSLATPTYTLVKSPYLSYICTHF